MGGGDHPDPLIVYQPPCHEVELSPGHWQSALWDLITYLDTIFYRVRFRQKLGLNSILASWDLKIRIPRRKLRI